MTGNQIAYANLKETIRHNKVSERINRSDVEERQRHNVNTEMATIQRNQNEARYNDMRIKLDNAKINLEHWKASNSLEIQNDRNRIDSSEITRKQNRDNQDLELRRIELGLKTVGEVRKAGEDLMRLSPTFGINNILGGINNGQKTKKRTQKSKIDPREIERRLFK